MSDHATQRGFSLRSIFCYLVKRHRDARSTRHLLDLPDAVLADIGLNRWDVQNALYVGWSKMPSKTLSSTAAANRSMQTVRDATPRRVPAGTVQTPDELRLAA